MNAPDRPDIPGSDDVSNASGASHASTHDDAAQSARHVGALTAARERVLAALMDVPTAIAIVRGPNHVYDFANEAYRDLTRFADPIGAPFGGSGANSAGDALRVELDRVYATGRAFVNREVATRLDRDGDGRFEDAWFDIACQPIRGASDDVEGIVIHATEITRHVQARLAALQTQKLESLGILAGGIAHDFNNLLTGILGNASVALLEMSGDASGRIAIQDVLHAARRAAALARQLLTYSGNGHREIGAVDLSTQVREIVQLVEASVSKKVGLALDVAIDLPAIDADAAQLQQVIMNLVLNAAESIGDGRGTVHVATGTEIIDARGVADLVAAAPIPPGPYVYVDVTDDGCGMDDATKARIFDPFFTTKISGRGLGLAAVVGIMRAHNGAIRIASRVGSGSSFRAYFPAGTRRASVSPDPEADMFRGSGVVLVIDDEPHVRTVARRMLEWFGFDVVDASGGREGIERFRERDDIALVLLDMMMPELNGEEVFRELRAIRPDVRVLLSSGYTEDETRERFRAEGLAGMVEKPYTTAQLAARIAKALKPRE